MMGAILALALATSPNIFDPAEMSTEDILTGVTVCSKRLLAFKDTTEKQAVTTCTCLMDAQRANRRNGLDPTPTPEQVKRCNDRQKQHAKPSAPDGGRAGS